MQTNYNHSCFATFFPLRPEVGGRTASLKGLPAKEVNIWTRLIIAVGQLMTTSWKLQCRFWVAMCGFQNADADFDWCDSGISITSRRRVLYIHLEGVASLSLLSIASSSQYSNASSAQKKVIDCGDHAKLARCSYGPHRRPDLPASSLLEIFTTTYNRKDRYMYPSLLILISTAIGL